MNQFQMTNGVRAAVAAALVSAVTLAAAFPAVAADDEEAAAKEAWREAIVRTEVPQEGCFYAHYPSTTWEQTGCGEAPNRPYPPKSGAPETVGDGHDYMADAGTHLISKAVGSFPEVTGVKTEEDDGTKNSYSLQLNTNFLTTADACKGIKDCLSWQQFVYSSDDDVAFMQYWLINYDKKCPSGWMAFGKDCFHNSAGVHIPIAQPITELEHLKLSGSAASKGKDRLVFTAESDAWTVTGNDSVVDLASDWHDVEFNVFGDGGGSKADFNKGSSIEVKVAITDDSKSAPSCITDGTTAETNNLNLKSCSTVGGSTPAIEFTEKN